MAELGLGQDGSPRFVSGSATLSFRCDGSACLLRGWLGTRGPHEAQSAEERAADAAAIREQILRVFEAYRQKDQATLRRTHTADWRGFALSSAAVGKGIEAYMRAASRAMVSVQFEEYRILEFDAIFYGDIAIVPYVASVAGKTAQGRTESRLRVIDVYLRAPSGWIPLPLLAVGGAVQTAAVNGRIPLDGRPELIRSAHDSLFTSGTLGRYSKVLNSVVERHGYHK